MSKQWTLVGGIIALLVAGAVVLVKFSPEKSGVAIGDKAPDYRVVDLQTGDSVSLRERAKGKISIVNIWAIWCGPCKMVSPVVDELARENEGKLRVMKLDVDENQNTAMQYGVMSIPTLILFKGGQPVERIVGFKPKGDLAKKILPHLS
jgi:thioredoxin 1